jgi:transcriptional regulator with XRE-family HTH domain
MNFDFETNQRSIRRFLNLRLIDLERACGISATRISQSERGVLELRPQEQRIITNFLRAKLDALLSEQLERDRK